MTPSNVVLMSLSLTLNISSTTFMVLIYCFYPYRYLHISPAAIYLFKVNNGKTITICEICSKLTIKTPELRGLRHSGSLLLTLNRF